MTRCGALSSRLADSKLETRNSKLHSGLLFRFAAGGVKYKIWGYPLDIHKMSGVMFVSKVVLGVLFEGFLPQSQRGRGGRGVQVRPKFVAILSVRQVLAGQYVAALRSAERSFTVPTHAFARRVAVRPTKSSPRRWHQRVPFQVNAALTGVFFCLSCRSGFRHRNFALGGMLFAVASDKDQPGASFLSTIRWQAKRPPQPSGRKLSLRAGHFRPA